MASDRRRGSVEGLQQLRRPLQHGECLPNRKTLAEQLMACAGTLATPPIGGESSVSDPPKRDVAPEDFDDLDYVWEVAEISETDNLDETYVSATLG